MAMIAPEQLGHLTELQMKEIGHIEWQELLDERGHELSESVRDAPEIGWIAFPRGWRILQVGVRGGFFYLRDTTFTKPITVVHISIMSPKIRFPTPQERNAYGFADAKQFLERRRRPRGMGTIKRRKK